MKRIFVSLVVILSFISCDKNLPDNKKFDYPNSKVWKHGVYSKYDAQKLEGVFDVDMVIRARKGIIVDAEWVDLTVADGFALYDGKVSNQPKYKVTGNVVTVMGVLTPTEEFTSSTTGVNIASGIPANLRPSVNLQFVCHGSSMNRWDCSITTGGAVTISRYGTTAATTVTAGAWLPFCCTYQI